MAPGKKRKRVKNKNRTTVLLGLIILSMGLYGLWHSGFFSRISRSSQAPANSSSDDEVLNTNPKIVFIIDDIGYNLDAERELKALGDDVVYSILPLLPYSRHFASASQTTKADVILHLPLETVSGTIPGRGLISRQMEPSYVLEMLATDLASVPGNIGANNHMGSLGTSDPALMRIILKEMKRRNLFFIDSYTTPDSVVSKVAQELGMRVLVRDVFLDNVDAKNPIRGQIRLLKSKAREKGYAIAIGHYRKNTLEVLREDIPKLRREGFEVLSLKQLLRYLDHQKK